MSQKHVTFLDASKNSKFKVLIYFHVLIHGKCHDFIAYCIPCVSVDTIDNVIKFSKFGLADGTEISGTLG